MRQRDAGAAGGFDRGQRHGGGHIVGSAVRRMMKVVELADRGVPVPQQIGVELGRHGGETVRVDAVRNPVHDVSPGPESAGPFGLLRQPRHCILECVGMKVRHAGNNGAAGPRQCPIRVPRVRYAGNCAVRINSNCLIGSPPVGQ